MKKSPLFLLILSILFLAVWACGGSENTETIPAIDPDTGKSYFFLVEGKYREYNVDEIRYLAVDISDTLTYQLREEVGAAFTSPGGQVSHIINRFTRPDDTQPWVLDSVWAARVETDRAVSVENNIPIVKMTFPTIVDRFWDANVFNPAALDTFRVTQFGTPFNIGGIASFLEAMVIEQHDDEDGITFRDIRREVYADSIGLVLKEYNVVKFCSTPECLGLEIIQSGRFYRERLFNHGFVDEDD